VDWRALQPSWLWCDDFESDAALEEDYFDLNRANGRMAVDDSEAVGGQSSLRSEYLQGAAGAGWVWKAFGDNPVANTGSEETHEELFWRFYMKMEAGWEGQPYKITRGTMFTAPDWSQGMIAHLWEDEALGTQIDPVSCVSDSSVVCDGYNDFDNMQWLGQVSGIDQIYAADAVGRWRCIEIHVRLNDPGMDNGVFEWWIDGVHQGGRTDLNWRGEYVEYGINAIALESYWNGGAARTQRRYFDNFVISTARIGCGEDTGGAQRPEDVQNLRRTDRK
jgi:hypothetical protein